MQRLQGHPTKLSWALVTSHLEPWTVDREGAGTGFSFTRRNTETQVRAEA